MDLRAGYVAFFCAAIGISLVACDSKRTSSAAQLTEVDPIRPRVDRSGRNAAIQYAVLRSMLPSEVYSKLRTVNWSSPRTARAAVGDSTRFSDEDWMPISTVASSATEISFLEHCDFEVATEDGPNALLHRPGILVAVSLAVRAEAWRLLDCGAEQDRIAALIEALFRIARHSGQNGVVIERVFAGEQLYSALTLCMALAKQSDVNSTSSERLLAHVSTMDDLDPLGFVDGYVADADLVRGWLLGTQDVHNGEPDSLSSKVDAQARFWLLQPRHERERAALSFQRAANEFVAAFSEGATQDRVSAIDQLIQDGAFDSFTITYLPAGVEVFRRHQAIRDRIQETLAVLRAAHAASAQRN